MTDDELISYNKMGFIPGEKEDEETFLKRIQFNLSLENSFGSNPELVRQLKATHLKSFDLKIDWTPIFYGNQKLSPWQGGCAWIFQTEKEGPLGAVIQLREAFHKKGRYFGLKVEEILEHELIHVGRMAFDEPKYEEFLAYDTSSSKFRRFWGPLFQSSWESLLFIFLLLIPLLFDLTLLYQGDSDQLKRSILIKLLPLGFLGFLFMRLLIRRRKFEKARQRLIDRFGEKGEAILYRLTDREIESVSVIQNLDDLFKESSLRLKQIRLSYL